MAETKRCSVRGCTRPHAAKGLCHSHYVSRSMGYEVTGPVSKQHRLTQRERANAIAWRRDGKSVKWIAAKLGVGKITIQRLAKRNGLGGAMSTAEGRPVATRANGR